MVIRTPPTSPWRPGRCVVTGLYRILQEEIRCWPPKGRNRLPRSLVQIGGDSATQAAHPDSPRALGAHTGRLRHMGFWGRRGWSATDTLEVSQIAHAERRPSTWVGDLCRGAVSDAHGPAGKPEPQPFRAPRANFPVQDHLSWACTVMSLIGVSGGILACTLG